MVKTQMDSDIAAFRDAVALEVLKCIINREGMNDEMLGGSEFAAHSFAENDTRRAYIYADAMIRARED